MSLKRQHAGYVTSHALQACKAWDGFMQASLDARLPHGLAEVTYPQHDRTPAAVMNEDRKVAELQQQKDCRQLAGLLAKLPCQLSIATLRRRASLERLTHPMSWRNPCANEQLRRGLRQVMTACSGLQLSLIA